jgi:protein-export membrane protein SecD
VEALIARQGANRILVQLPGVEDPARIKDLLGRNRAHDLPPAGRERQPRAATPPPGVMFLNGERPGRALPGAPPRRGGWRQPLRRARQPGQPLGEWVVNFTFDSVGTRRFSEITRANVGRPFAIVLDEKVITAPVIREPITGGRGQISGSFTVRSANDLAVLLRAGALPAPLTVGRGAHRRARAGRRRHPGRASSASPWARSSSSSTWASPTGCSGWFANIALFVNIVLLVACLSLLEATLTCRASPASC